MRLRKSKNLGKVVIWLAGTVGPVWGTIVSSKLYKPFMPLTGLAWLTAAEEELLPVAEVVPPKELAGKVMLAIDMPDCWARLNISTTAWAWSLSLGITVLATSLK